MAKIYHPIAKVGTGRLGFQIAIRSRLYAGPDHLLIVQNTGYTEEYKRVAYADIRYLMVVPTNGQVQQGMISGAITIAILFCNLGGLPWVAVGILASPFIVWFIVNGVLGPTCRCYLNTDVQTVQLPVPRRMNKVALFRAYLQSQLTTAPSAGAAPAVSAS